MVLPHQTPGTSYAASVAVPPMPNALAHAILAVKRRRLCGVWHGNLRIRFNGLTTTKFARYFAQSGDTRRY